MLYSFNASTVASAFITVYHTAAPSILLFGKVSLSAYTSLPLTFFVIYNIHLPSAAGPKLQECFEKEARLVPTDYKTTNSKIQVES